MQEFVYLEPKSLRQACRLLNQYQSEAKLIAGGVSLLAMMKNRLLRPHVLVNIKAVRNLDSIRFSPRRGLKIGPLVLHRNIVAHPLIRERFGLLAEAASEIGSPPIRNMGTIGGNLCHADPAGDIAPALLCLGAQLKLARPRGERIVPIDKFCTDYYATCLGPDEILAEICIPVPSPGRGEAYLKMKRTATDMAVSQVAACVTRDGTTGKCKQARIVLGAVGPYPIFAREAGESLEGKGFLLEELEHASILAAAQAQPSSDARGSADYKKEMVKVQVKRALQLAWERSG